MRILARMSNPFENACCKTYLVRLTQSFGQNLDCTNKAAHISEIKSVGSNPKSVTHKTIKSVFADSWPSVGSLRRPGLNRTPLVGKNVAFLALEKDEEHIEIYAEKHSIDEDRYITIGLAGEILFVMHTERKDTIRLISAGLATARERKWYYGYGEG